MSALFSRSGGRDRSPSAARSEPADPFDVAPDLLRTIETAHGEVDGEAAMANGDHESILAPFSRSNISALGIGQPLFTLSLAPRDSLDTILFEAIFGILQNEEFEKSRLDPIMASITGALQRLVFSDDSPSVQARQSSSAFFSAAYLALIDVVISHALSRPFVRRVIYCALVAASSRWRAVLIDDNGQYPLEESGIPSCFLAGQEEQGHEIPDSLVDDFDAATEFLANHTRVSKRRQQPTPPQGLRPADAPPFRPPPPCPPGTGFRPDENMPDAPPGFDPDGDPNGDPHFDRPCTLAHLQAAAQIPIDKRSRLSPNGFGVVFRDEPKGGPVALALFASLPALRLCATRVDPRWITTPNVTLDCPESTPYAQQRISIRISGEKALGNIPPARLKAALDQVLGESSTIHIHAWVHAGPDDGRGCWDVDVRIGSGQIFEFTRVGSPPLVLSGFAVVIFPHCKRAWQVRLPWGRLVFRISALPQYAKPKDMVDALENLFGPILSPRDGDLGYQDPNRADHDPARGPPFPWHIPPLSISLPTGSCRLAVSTPDAVRWLLSCDPAIDGVPVIIDDIPQHNAEVHQRIRQTVEVSMIAPTGPFHVDVLALTLALTDLFQGHTLNGKHPRVVMIVPKALDRWETHVRFYVTFNSMPTTKAVIGAVWELRLDSEDHGVITLSLSVEMRNDNRNRSSSRASRGRSGTPGPRRRHGGQAVPPAPPSSRSRTPAKQGPHQPSVQPSTQSQQRPTSLSEACTVVAQARPAGLQRIIEVLATVHGKSAVMKLLQDFDPSRPQSTHTTAAINAAAKLTAALNTAANTNPAPRPVPQPQPPAPAPAR